MATLAGLNETGHAYSISITDATVAASALNTLDGKTTVAIDAASIDELTCATADLNTAYTAFDAGTITGLSNEDASLSDSTLAASVLNILDANTSGTIDAACSMNSLARSLISTQASTQKSSAIWHYPSLYSLEPEYFFSQSRRHRLRNLYLV